MTTHNKEAGALPPTAQKIEAAHTHHGITKTDPYAWIRDDKWQEVMRNPDVLDPEIRTLLEAENAYLEDRLSFTEDLQKTLFAEMKGRIKEDDSTVPSPDGPFSYFVKYETGGQHPIFCRKPRDGSGETVLVDGNVLAKGKAYFKLGGISHCPDHGLIAYGADDKGSEYYTITFKDADSGEPLSDTIEDTTGSVVWSADSRTVFYTRVDDNHRPSKVFCHTLGTPTSEDKLIYEESDPGFFVGISKTQSGDFILLSAHDHQTSEIHLIDAHSPLEAPRLIERRDTGHEYDVEHRDDTLYILTNDAGAEDFKLVTTPVDAPSRTNWTDLVPHKPGRMLLGMTVYQNHITWLEREDGLPKIIINTIETGEQHAISFDEEAYSLGMSGSYEFDTTLIRFSYSSMTTPSQIFDYDMKTRERTLRKTQEVPSGHESDDYITKRLMAPAEDGELVPISLVYKKGVALDGSAPLLLYGYGAYGITIPSSFSTTILSLVDRGFIYAIAHIRGGKDKGYAWYKDGRGDKKTNTFKDFITAGEYLSKENYTSRGQIVAHGGSAGGMLMGAVANMAPDLFSGIIAEVPFVDVLATMLDDTLPLTPPEWPEWGNPITDKKAYETIAAYSPYDQVSKQNYPAILAIGGLADPRVTYWEPAKWIAKLRAYNQSSNPLFLKTNMEAGHGGASGRFDRLEEVALNYAFALYASGLIKND